MPRSNSSSASSRSSRSSTGSMSNFANEIEAQMMENRFKSVVKDPRVLKMIEEGYREDTERKLNLLMKRGPAQKRPSIRHKQKPFILTVRLSLALSTKMAFKKRPAIKRKRSKKKVNPLLRVNKTKIKFKKK